MLSGCKVSLLTREEEPNFWLLNLFLCNMLRPPHFSTKKLFYSFAIQTKAITKSTFDPFRWKIFNGKAFATVNLVNA